MTVVVVGKLNAGSLQVCMREGVEYSLRNHYGTIGETHNLSLNDCRDGHIHNLVYGNVCSVEHLRNNNHRIVAGCANAKSKVACRTAHS